MKKRKYRATLRGEGDVRSRRGMNLQGKAVFLASSCMSSIGRFSDFARTFRHLLLDVRALTGMEFASDIAAAQVVRSIVVSGPRS